MEVKATPCGLTEELSNKFANMSLVCSFFVVFIHTGTACTDGDATWWAMHLLKDGLCRIAVPFFFIASGFFLAGHCTEDGWWRKECQKRIHTLLIPYLIWCTVYFLYSFGLTVAANIYSHAELSRTLPASIHAYLNIYGLTFESMPLFYPLWFLRWLIILVLCSKAFLWILKRGSIVGVAYLILLLGMAVYCTPLFKEHSIFQVVSFHGIFFFNLGLYLRLFTPRFRMACSSAVGLFLAGMCAFALVLYGRLAALGEV